MSGKVINQFWAVLGQPAAHPSFRAAAETAQRLAEENPGREFFVMNLQAAYRASVEVSSLPIERPLPDAGPQSEDDGWIKWDGGPCPVEGSTRVTIRLRSGFESSGRWASDCDWSLGGHGNPGDIVAYKVLAS